MAHGWSWSHTRWMQLEQGGRHEERVERRRRMQPAQLLVATRYYDRRPTTSRRAPASRFIRRVRSRERRRGISVAAWTTARIERRVYFGIISLSTFFLCMSCFHIIFQDIKRSYM